MVKVRSDKYDHTGCCCGRMEVHPSQRSMGLAQSSSSLCPGDLADNVTSTTIEDAFMTPKVLRD